MNNKPFLLRPAFKDYIWGGERLKNEFNKDTDKTPLAESWECSIHPDGESVIIGGEFDKRTLKSVLEENPDYLGSHPDKSFGFPLLIKLIDAKEDLSIQVHPDDDYAFVNENCEHGKTEMWYVLDAKKDAKLVYGFNHDTSAEDVKRAIEKGTIERHLNKVRAKKDDVFFVSPGTVHAIGSGLLIAEIQESSNVTYRLYDYNRTDKNGNKRELHVDRAMDIVNFKKSTDPAQPLRVLKYKRGFAAEFLARCQYFEVFRMLINTTEYEDLSVPFKSDELSFRVLLCLEGSGEISFASKIEDKSLEVGETTEKLSKENTENSDLERIQYKKGDCIFVPANSIELNIYGKAEFLDVRG